MISHAESLELAEKAFPKGPETLAEHLGVSVHYSSLSGCEGWCIRRGSNSVIRINSASSTKRQRFTLAHELAHLVLGSIPGIALEPFKSKSVDEQAADQLASELLIPESKAKAYLADALPVDAKTLRKLAKAAKVSPIMAACRIVSMTETLQLQNAAVAFFDSNGTYQWRYSSGLEFEDKEATELHQSALTSPQPVRTPNGDGNTIVGSAITADSYSALFMQLLPPPIAGQQTIEEKLANLRRVVFDGDLSFQQSVAACLGYIRNMHSNLTVSKALHEFDKKYLQTKWTPKCRDKLRSPEGREFLRIELAKSCAADP